MRIFLSAQQALRRHDVPGYAFWEGYFKSGLAEAGHTVVEAPEVDWAEGLTALDRAARRVWLDRTWGRTLDHLRTEHARAPVHLFLSYLFPDQVEPAAVQAIRTLGIPTVNFFCDNVREFTRVPDTFRAFDLHWVPEKDARPLYAGAGLRSVAAPMPMWVPAEFRQPAAVETDDVTFCGSHDVLREELLGDAVARGLNLRLHGAGWTGNPASVAAPRDWLRTLGNQAAFLRRYGLRGFAMRRTYQQHRPRPRAWIDAAWRPSLSPAEYMRVTRESTVVLGVNRYPGFRHPFAAPGRYPRLRDLEAPMAGACYLTEDAPGLDELFDPESEIATYRDAAGLVEQVARLRADPARRRAMRRRAQQRALAEHTVGRTVGRLAAELGLTP